MPNSNTESNPAEVQKGSGSEASNSKLQINPSEFKILVTDDVPANVLLLKMVLSRSGYQVITNTDPRKVQEIVDEQKPDLILLDVMMPGLSGFEVCKLLKAEERTKDIPVIFLTALDNSESMLEGFQAGGSDYIGKPFEKDVLLVRIHSQLQLVAARRVIESQNEELRETIYGRDKLYSVIAHDLRSPLGAIQLTTKMLEDMLPPDVIGEDMHGLVVECNKQVTDLFALLDNLLKWTKSQTGTLKVVFQDFEISTVIDAVYDMYYKVSEMKGVHLSKEVQNDKVMVHADIDMCKTVLRNFLSNAIKFSEAGSNIEIIQYCADGCAVVGVRDHGCGMTEEEMGRLFNKDTHFSKYGTHREEGSGLGLLLCKNFAEAIGGKLTVESEVGKGSTFSMYIPVTQQ
ncbi:MAG: hybrid sensor histidine kinase/response regulator [Bacteroidaceae bacterium]|nr:hybrid sensor histidine kinase/response regulator [Bacteroidaceae bacterium]